MTEKIINSITYVKDNSKHVKINYANIDSLIAVLTKSNNVYWLSSNPFGLLDLSIKDIVNFLLYYHAIGFCYWGNPKWTIKTPNGFLDGAYALIYIMLNYYKENKNFNLTFPEFQELLKGNVEIPLLKERYKNITEINNYTKDHNFYQEIKGFKDDNSLLEYIISNFKCYCDESKYQGQTIYLEKRASLLTSDILNIRKLKENISVDLSHLVGCADYKIPQVLNAFGILEYRKPLEEKIKNEVPLLKNSAEEIEIRANTLIVIDYIFNKLHGKYSKIEINDLIWLLSQNKSLIQNKYHRTLTESY